MRRFFWLLACTTMIGPASLLGQEPKSTLPLPVVETPAPLAASPVPVPCPPTCEPAPGPRVTPCLPLLSHLKQKCHADKCDHTGKGPHCLKPGCPICSKTTPRVQVIVPEPEVVIRQTAKPAGISLSAPGGSTPAAVPMTFMVPQMQMSMVPVTRMEMVPTMTYAMATGTMNVANFSQGALPFSAFGAQATPFGYPGMLPTPGMQAQGVQAQGVQAQGLSASDFQQLMRAVSAMATKNADAQSLNDQANAQSADEAKKKSCDEKIAELEQKLLKKIELLKAELKAEINTEQTQKLQAAVTEIERRLNLKIETDTTKLNNRIDGLKVENGQIKIPPIAK